MGVLKGAIQKYTPKSVQKEVFDDIFGWETPMEALEGMGTGGLPLGLLGEQVEEKVGSLQYWDPPVPVWGPSATPASVPANGDSLDSWAWTQQYLAGQRAVAEAAEIQSEEQAEAIQARSSAAPNGTVMPVIVPAIILLYLVWTK